YPRSEVPTTARAHRGRDRLWIGKGNHPALRLLAQQLGQNKSAVARGASTHVVSRIEQSHRELTAFHSLLYRFGGVRQFQNQVVPGPPHHARQALSLCFGKSAFPIGHYDYTGTHVRNVSPLISAGNTSG